MPRWLLAALALLLPATAWADSTVPALPAATSLSGGVSYLAGPASADLKYGFSPTTMCLASGNLTICSGGITASMLATGVAAANMGSAGGDLTGTYPNPTVAKIQGQAVSSTPATNGQALVWSSGSSMYVPTSVASGSGTVTSVALTMPAIFAVTGSPITTTGTLAVAANGTSGGVPCFTSTSVMASSALLTQFALMTGGGAGACPSNVASIGTTTTLLHGNAAGLPTFSAVSLTADVTGTLPVGNGGTGAATFTSNLPLIGNGASAIAQGTVTGNTTKFATSTGALTSGHCVSIDASGNFIDSSVVGCGAAGGSGTVTAGTAGQLAWYSASTNAVVGNANATISSGTLTLGQATSVIGKLLLSGNTSGVVTIAPQAAAGTYEFDLPITAGTTGQPLLSAGGAGSPMTFGTLGVAAGGSGLATKTIHSIQVGNGTSAETQLAVGGTGTVLTGVSASDPAFSATPVLGVAGATLGSLGLSGNTSGVVTVSVAAAAGTWTMKLPTSGGTAGQVLTTDGTGITSWATSAVTLPLALVSGGTHADLSATGGASQVLRQSTVGANITVSQLASTDISGLGTAAIVNTGTSGATIPLLNGNNTWSGTFTLNNSFTLSGATFVTPTNFTSGATFSFGSSDNIVCIKKASGSATTANLPASPANGRVVGVKDCKQDALTNNITVKTTDGSTIDTVAGATGFTMNINGEYRGFQYVSANNDWMSQ